MFTRKRNGLMLVALSLSIALLPTALNATGVGSGLGQPASPSDISSWNDDTSPSGNLPPGRGSVAQGQQIYATQCSACHGDKGQGGPMDKLVGGVGTLDTKAPVKTVGSYWPYATTIFDYVRRAMPFNAPGTLNNDQVYAVTAYLLYMNGVVPQSAVMNGRSLAAVRMPNHDNFVQKDPRPDAP